MPCSKLCALSKDESREQRMKPRARRFRERLAHGGKIAMCGNRHERSPRFGHRPHKNILGKSASRSPLGCDTRNGCSLVHSPKCEFKYTPGTMSTTQLLRLYSPFPSLRDRSIGAQQSVQYKLKVFVRDTNSRSHRNLVCSPRGVTTRELRPSMVIRGSVSFQKNLCAQRGEKKRKFLLT